MLHDAHAYTHVSGATPTRYLCNKCRFPQPSAMERFLRLFSWLPTPKMRRTPDSRSRGSHGKRSQVENFEGFPRPRGISGNIISPQSFPGGTPRGFQMLTC